MILNAKYHLAKTHGHHCQSNSVSAENNVIKISGDWKCPGFVKHF